MGSNHATVSGASWLRPDVVLGALPLLGLTLALAAGALLLLALALHTASHRVGLQLASGCLLAGLLLIAAFVAFTLRPSARRAQARSARDAGEAQSRIASEAVRSQALLERLSIATQGAGIYCWELDWSTYAISWDDSRLPASEAAAASQRHFGAELGGDLFKWVHPDDRHAGGKAMTESLARGEDHVSFRYRIVLPDGSIRHVHAFARTYCDAAGAPKRSLGVSWDVTAEVEAAATAARNAANERAMFERLSVATQAAGLTCWEFDFKQRKVVWLDGLDSQECTPEQIALAGQAMFDQILPEDDRIGRALTEQALREHRPIVTSRSRRRDADGTVRHLLIYQRLFYDEQGERARALGAMVDVTESFQRQVELEALSLRFGIATRAAKAGVWEFRVTTQESWWNDTMYGIYGCSPESFTPNIQDVLAMIHPDDLPIAQAAWDEALETTSPLHVQFRIVRPDRSVAHVESLAVVVTDAETQQRRLVGITLDISQRVAAEQRERLLQKQLREASHESGMAEVATGVLHNVGNVLNSLGVAYTTARTRLKGYPIDRVARVAAMLEENSTRLADFLTQDDRGKRLPGYLTVLGAKLESDSDAVQREFDAISGHIQYLRQIVQAQQSFARVTGARDDVDVNELLQTALTLRGQELSGVEIVRDIGELPAIQTDRYKLLQIVVNFIANACDAMADNAARAARIVLRVHVVQDLLEIAVEDSGIGIAPELLARVWEFGFTTKAQGHGFGLHSAAVAAQQLGGAVAAHSDGVGLGARFSVTVPISQNLEAERLAAA